MGGRHRTTSRGSSRRWLAGAAGLAIAGAAVLSITPANAATGVVTATFGVTGVSTSNCKLSTAQIAGLNGKMVIDPGKATAETLPLSATKTLKYTGLTAGNHTYTWTA